MSAKNRGSGLTGRDWFATTHWSLVVTAGDSRNADSQKALGILCQTYWYPVYAYLRRRGCNPDLAEDLTQGFFADFLAKRSIKAATPDRGRFRSFLLASVKHYLSHERERSQATKRGGSKVHLSLDLQTGEGRYLKDPFHEITPERLFEKQWALAFLDRTLASLREEMKSAEREDRFDALKGFLTESEVKRSYQEVAAESDMSESTVKGAVHRMRRRFGKLLKAEIANTVSDQEQIEGEIRHLLSALAE